VQSGRAPKTRELFRLASGGVLFVDGAYSLAGGGVVDNGHEAVAELIHLMENYRHETAVFFAGYESEMNGFIDLNRGVSSRISGRVVFEPNTNEELWRVLERMATIQSYVIDHNARAVTERWFDDGRIGSVGVDRLSTAGHRERTCRPIRCHVPGNLPTSIADARRHRRRPVGTVGRVPVGGAHPSVCLGSRLQGRPPVVGGRAVRRPSRRAPQSG